MAGCRRPAEPWVRSSWWMLGASPQSCWAGSSCCPSDASCSCEVAAAKSSQQGEQSSLLGGPVCAPGWEIAIEFRAREMTENLAANATFQAPVQKATEESQQPELWYLAGRALRMQLFGCPLCYPISFVLTGFASGMLHSAGSSPSALISEDCSSLVDFCRDRLGMSAGCPSWEDVRGTQLRSAYDAHWKVSSGKSFGSPA